MSSVLPALAFKWNPSVKDAVAKIQSLNKRLKEYAVKNDIPYIDYYDKMVDSADGSMCVDYTKDGSAQALVSKIGFNILNANRIPQRMVFYVKPDKKVVNAVTYFRDRQIVVYGGLLTYSDNEDELAAVIAHEISHAIDSYDGVLRGFFSPVTYSLKPKGNGFIHSCFLLRLWRRTQPNCLYDTEISGNGQWQHFFPSHRPVRSILLQILKERYRSKADPANQQATGQQHPLGRLGKPIEQNAVNHLARRLGAHGQGENAGHHLPHQVFRGAGLND